MKYPLLALLAIPCIAIAGPFDLLLQQKNVAGSATFTRTATPPELGVNSILGLGSMDNLPVLWKLSPSITAGNGMIYIQPLWAEIVDKPPFAPVATTGDYNDLINKPSITQANPDWLATSGPSEIFNKPALSAVATSGAYSDLSGAPSLFSGEYGDLTGVPSTFPPSAHTQAFSTITSTPTTLAGYGITDGATLTQLATKYAIPAGTTAQYVRGDGSLALLPAPGAGTVTGVTAGAGLSGGVITSSGTISMPNVGSAGSYNTVTTDAQGRVSSGTMRSQSSATRSLNSAFQVSATRDAAVQYAVQTTITASIAGGQDADVFLDIASDSGFTANVQSLDVAPCSQTYTLAIALQGVQKCAAQVRGFVPAGYYARIRTVSNTGTPVFAYRLGQEVLQ